MDQIESLPLFPLSDVVLLPEISIPLNLFELRYRQMIHDVLSGSQQIGMVTVHPDGLALMAGDPPTFDIGCLGHVANAQEQPDGTFQILLLGVSRFRILQEHERSGDRLYRSARVELLSDESPMDAEGFERLADRRRAVLVLLERLVQRVGRKDAAEQAVSVFDRLEPARLINSLTQAIAFLPVERQRLLEANSLISRFEIMADLLRFRLAEFETGEPGSTLLPN